MYIKINSFFFFFARRYVLQFKMTFLFSVVCSSAYCTCGHLSCAIQPHCSSSEAITSAVISRNTSHLSKNVSIITRRSEVFWDRFENFVPCWFISFFKIGKKINKQILSLPFSRDFRTKDEIPDFLPLVHTKFFDRFSTGDRFPSISFRVQISTEPRNDAGIKIEIKISIQSTKDSVYYYSILDFHPTPFSSKLVAFFVTIAWFSWLKTVFVYERKDLNIVHRFNFFNLISSALIFCFVLQVNISSFAISFFF